MYYVEPHHYEIAKQNGISKKNLINRVYEKGWTIERAISQPVKIRSTHDWEKWESVAKVSKSTYMQRVRGGWEKDKAALTPALSRKEVVALSNNPRKIFTDIQEAEMLKKDIPRATAYMRVKKLGWSIDKAISTPVISKSESLCKARAMSGMGKIIFGRNAN